MDTVAQVDNDDERKFTEDGYTNRIMSNLLELRKNGEFCDVVLAVEDTDFSVHKVILVASSPYFSAMFKGNMSEKCQEKVLQFISSETFHHYSQILGK